MDREIKTGNIPPDIDISVVQKFIELGRISFDVTCAKTGSPGLIDGTSSINTRQPSNLGSPTTPSKDDQAQSASQLQALTPLQQPTKDNPVPSFPYVDQGFNVNRLSPGGIFNATYAAPSPVGDGDLHMAALHLGCGDQFDPDFSWLPNLDGSGPFDESNPLSGFSQ